MFGACAVPANITNLKHSCRKVSSLGLLRQTYQYQLWYMRLSKCSGLPFIPSCRNLHTRYYTFIFTKSHIYTLALVRKHFCSLEPRNNRNCGLGIRPPETNPNDQQIKIKTFFFPELHLNMSASFQPFHRVGGDDIKKQGIMPTRQNTDHSHGLATDCGNSRSLAMGLPQSWAKLSTQCIIMIKLITSEHLHYGNIVRHTAQLMIHTWWW